MSPKVTQMAIESHRCKDFFQLRKNVRMVFNKIKKDGQMPTMIPGSSHAAKMLAEVAPEIRKMGFGVDVDGKSVEMPVMNMPMGMNGPVERTTQKVYLNDPCPFGSGKKFKKCCGRN